MPAYRQVIKNRFLDEVLNSWGLENKPKNVQYVAYLKHSDGTFIVVTPPTRTSVLIMNYPEIGEFEVYQIQMIAQCLSGCVLETTLEGEDILRLAEDEAWGMQRTLERVNKEYMEALFNTDENRT